MKFSFLLTAVCAATAAAGLGWWQAGPAGDSRAASEPGPQTPHPAGASVTRKKPAGDVWQPWEDKLTRATTSAELAELAAEVAAITDFAERTMVLRLLTARWAEVDPTGGLAWWQEDRKELAQGRYFLLTEWALLDVEATWTAVSSQSDPTERTRMASEVGHSLLHENPDVFAAWFQRARVPLPPAGGDPSPAWLAFARRNPEMLEALAAELATPPKDATSRFNTPPYAGLYTLLARLRAERDPAAALAWVMAAPEEVRNQCLVTVLPLLAKTDLAAATKALKSIKDFYDPFISGSWNSNITAGIATEIAKTDPIAAVEWLARNPGQNETAAATSIAQTIRNAIKEGRLSPKEAYALIRDRKSEGEAIRLNVPRDMWEGLSAAQLQEAAVWLKAEESDFVKGWALSGLVTEWAKTDPQAAMAFAGTLDDAEVRQGVYFHMAESRFHRQEGPAAMKEMLSSIPPADRAAVISAQARMWFGNGLPEHEDLADLPSFAGAVQADALTDTPPDASRDTAAKRVFETWGALQPDAALAWAVQQPDPALRQTALAATMDGWIKYDAWAASQWLASQPRGPDRDVAAHQLVRSLSTQEPDSAWTWAADIGDESIRLEARAAVLLKWREADAEAAQAAVSTLTEITPAARQKLADTLAGKDP